MMAVELERATCCSELIRGFWFRCGRDSRQHVERTVRDEVNRATRLVFSLCYSLLSYSIVNCWAAAGLHGRVCIGTFIQRRADCS